MKNNFLSKAYGGMTEARHKLNDLGLPRQWKVITSTLLLLFTFAIGNVWAADAVFNGPTDLSSSWAKGKSFTITTTTNGVIADNTIYYSSSEGKVDNSKINPYRVGFVFKPQVNCNLTITARASSTGKNCTHLIYEVNDSLYNLYKDATGKYMTAYIISTYASDANQVALWKAVSVLKNQASLQANGDSAKVLCGYTVKSRLLTLVATSKSQSISNSADQVYTLIDADEDEIVFEAGKKYLMFTNTGSSGVALKSLSFSPVATTSYTVTIDPNGGSYASTPDGWTYSAGVYTKSIASGTSFSAPAGLSNGTKDLTWKDGVGTDITFPQTITGDITFVAQWADHTESSDATLSALSVAGCTLNETFDPDDEDYTVDLPFYASMPVAGDVTATKNDEHAATPAVSVSGNEITIHCEAEDGTTTKDYTITVTIAPAPAASSSINIEQWVLDNGAGKGNGKVTEQTATLLAALTTANIAYTNANELDSLTTASGRNEPYLGLKFKSVSSTITIIVPAEQTLKVKFGERKTAVQVAINDGAASAATITDGIYSLAATSAVRQVKFSVTQDNKTIVLKQVMVGEDIKTVTLPWLVTYTVGEHGTCAKAKETWKGSALTLPAVTPESGWDFDGWFTAASAGTKVGGAGEEYTPTADVELFAQYTAQASPFDLTALTYKIGSAAAENVGYVDGKFTYNIELPYAPSYDAITVAPTLKESTSYLKGDEVLTVSSLPGAATFTVVAAGGSSEQLYTVNFTKAAKDGVCLIWGDVANNSLTRNATKSQLNGTLANSNVRDNAVVLDELTGPKFQSNGYLSIALEGQDIKAGDQVKIFVTSLNGLADKLRVFNANEAIDANIVAISAENMTTRVNTVTMTADASTIYLRRGNDYDSWNPCVAYVAVYRIMNPILKAITINSRAGEIDALNDHHFSVLIPYDADLAALTIVPTIIRNAPHATTPEAVISNAGAWIEGDNTYRVMDKDGDYTDYTITLTRDVLKHSVSFNTHGGSAVDPVEVAHGEYLLAAPADPTKDENVFKFWSETEDGAEVDITTVQINADKTFHAVWEAEPAGIKLINGDVVNHTNFLTGTNETTVEIESVEHKCVDFTTAGSNRTTVASIADLKEFIQYNATTNKAKIKLTLYNTKSSPVSAYLHMLEEGSETPTTEEISIPAGEVLKTDFYEFNSEKNRSFYITCGNRDYIKVLQVKVIDDGTTTLKKAGQVGYSVNTLKSRIFAPQQSAISFEGLTINANAVCKPLSTTAMKIKNAYNISFHADAAMTLAVTTEGNQTYYVSATADGTTNETSFTGRKEFDITAGDWYIHAGSSELKLDKIEFIAPKCAEPTIDAQPVTNVTFGAGNLTASVTAHVDDGGTLSYQWYDASDDSEVTGADEATLTTTTEGTYYVIVTNTLADHSDNFIKSDEATLGYRTLNDATLSALSYGDPETAIALEADKYEYRVILNEGTVDVPALHATATMDPYPTVTITNATTFTDYNAQSTVHVMAEDGLTELTYTVNFIVKHIYTALEDVTGSTTWNWSGSIDQTINDVPNKGVIIANYIEGDNFEMIEGKAGEYARRNQNGGVYQGTYLHFNTTVPGRVKFYFRAPSGGENCTITVKNGGRTVVAGTRTNSFGWSNEVFVNGDVVVEMVNDKEGGGTTRVQQVVFTAADPDYTRPVTEGRYGTICLPNGGVMVGADIFEIAYYGQTSEKIFFDNIPSGEMEAGIPYIFLPKAGVSQLRVFYTDAANASAGSRNGLIGSYTQEPITANEGNYILLNNQYCEVVTTAEPVYVGANRAYIKLSAINPHETALAPGRRRISMSVQGEQIATGLENGELNEAPRKVLINGELFILRGEKMYDAKGQLVK